MDLNRPNEIQLLNPLTAIQTTLDAGEDNYFSVYDNTNPYAVVNLLPPRILQYVDRYQVRDILELPEEEHLAHLKHGNGNPTLNRLRISFWNEYQRVLRNGGQIIFTRVHIGICGPIQFTQILERPYDCAWILRKPIDYLLMIEEGLNVGLDKLREMLNFSIYDEQVQADGSVKRIPNLPVCNLILKVVDKMDLRKHGAPKQSIKVQSQNMNMNVEVPSSDAIAQLDRIESELRYIASDSNAHTPSALSVPSTARS